MFAGWKILCDRGFGGHQGQCDPRRQPVRRLYWQEAWPLPTQKPVRFDGASFSFDPTGGVLNYFYEPTAEGSRAYFLEMPSLAVLRQFDQAPYCLGPRAKRWLLASPVTADQPGALSLFDQELPDPLIRFLPDLGGAPWTGRPRFSPDGLHLVWGNPSGAVTVVDLVEVNRRLSEIGLGW